MRSRYILISMFVLFAAACGSSPSRNDTANNAGPARTPTATSTAPTNVDTLAMGRQLYTAACAACHRADGTGGEITVEGKTIDPDDLTDDHCKKMPDQKMIEVIYNGIEDDGMPSFKGKLQEAEIREVVRYVRVGIQKMPDTSPAAKR